MEYAKRNPDAGAIGRYQAYEGAVATALAAQIVPPVAAGAPKVAAIAAPGIAAVGKAALKRAGDVAEIAGVAAALSGVTSPNADLPAGSPIDPKTSVEQVTRDSNRPKPVPGKSKILMFLLPLLGIAVEPPKPPATDAAMP